MTVPELLAASFEAHKLYRLAAGRINKSGAVVDLGDETRAREAVQQALEAREAADRLDPEHRDPAWAGQRAHEELLAFYRKYLG